MDNDIENNIPIADKIEYNLENLEQSNQVTAICVQPYRTTFQPVYLINVDTMTEEKQEESIQHREITQDITISPYHTLIYKRYQRIMDIFRYISNNLLKFIVPSIIFVIVIIGIYYNSIVY